MLTSSLEHYRRQQKLTATGLLSVKRARQSGVTRAAAVLTIFQESVARDAIDAVPLMLSEQGIDAPSEGRPDPRALSGVAADGRSLDGLLGQAQTDQQFDLMVATTLQDAARMGAALAMASRPKVGGYVRMLNPPSCSRCVILAGKFFKWNAGFQRHPLCDCRHIPTIETLAGDHTVNPDAYFHSLSAAEQDRLFTKAGAQAIRDGADINQVVNARRAAHGLSLAGGRLTEAEQAILRGGRARGALERVDVYGHKVFITREGITVRGLYGQSRGNFAKEAGKRYRATKAPRLMPESIYEIAKDREDAIRLLRVHGYLL